MNRKEIHVAEPVLVGFPLGGAVPRLLTTPGPQPLTSSEVPPPRGDTPEVDKYSHPSLPLTDRVAVARTALMPPLRPLPQSVARAEWDPTLEGIRPAFNLGLLSSFN